MSLPLSSPKWLTNCAQILNSFICFIVFFIFDLLDAVFCVIYRILDKHIEGESSPCCCSKLEKQNKKLLNHEYDGESDSLYERKSIFREMGFLQFGRKQEDSNRKCGEIRPLNRWSDCGCESCLSWVNGGDYKLHFVVKEPVMEHCRGNYPSENVIFLHGFLCSSSFWTQTLFPCVSENVNNYYRLIAIDLLGFGKSPKPRDCSYTLKDHVEMIQKSVIQPLQLSSFHLVAHSMGCIVALSLAAKYPTCVKSITLVAPVSTFTHERYDSFFRDLHFMTIDLTKHTHHSAWSSMHNVICGGAKFMDSYLEILTKARVRINVIQGDQDQVVPMECCRNIKLKAPNAEINVIPNADHSTVLFGREKEFSYSLEHTWESVDRSKLQ